MTTALLIIDVQRAAFDGVRCPPMEAPDRLLQSTGALLAAARAGGLPVVFVRHVEGAGEPFEEGSPQAELHESLVPAAGELVVVKRVSSAFEGTDLDARLKALGADHLVMSGLQSEFCVSNTTRSALQLGYAVTVVSDGHGTWPSNDRSAEAIRAEANATLAQAGARLATTQDLTDAWRAGS